MVHVGNSDQLNTTDMNAYSLQVGELGIWKLWLAAKEVCRVLCGESCVGVNASCGDKKCRGCKRNACTFNHGTSVKLQVQVTGQAVNVYK